MRLASWLPLDRVQSAFSLRARVRRGAALMAAGKSRSALRHYARAGRSGFAEAEYRIARCYIEGAGAPRSRREGLCWLLRAAHHGHVEAQALLAAIYLDGPPSEPTSDRSNAARLFGPDGVVGPDHVAAMRWARVAAERGSAKAQALLAFILTSGPTELRDLDQADLWYERSAAVGCPHGLLGHALALARKGGGEAQHRKVVAYLRAAAEAELPAALYSLGVFSEQGLGVARDQSAASEFYRRAAEKGHRSAQRCWGLALMRGAGIDANPSEGETWLRRAALAGDSEAAALVGNLHAAGGMLAPNYAEAASWFRCAAEAGHQGAARALGLLYLNGAGVAQDKEEAARWFRAAAAGGDTSASAELGNLLLKGIGKPDDTIYTCRNFEQAAASGDLVAAFNYGVCLAKGVGTERNDQQAAVWLRRAAASVVEAQFWYGRFLVEGRGVNRDPVEGHAWIARAAGGGHVGAQLAVREGATNGTGGGRAKSAVPSTLFKTAASSADGRAMTATIGGYAGDQGGPADPVVGRVAPPEDIIRESRGSSDKTLTEGDSMKVQEGLCACGSGLRSCRCCDLSASYFAPFEATEQIKALIIRARQALASDELAAAERLCLNILDVAPRVPDALWMLYQIRKRAGQRQAATVLLQRLVTVDPNRLDATQELAMLLFQRLDLIAAEHHARNAVRLAPLDPVSHNLMGMILTEAQRPQCGEFHYRRVIELTRARDPIVLANLAWNLKGQGRLVEARQLYEESVEAAPDVFQTWLGWGQLEEAVGNFAAARSKLERAGRIRPNDAGLRVARATLLSHEGNYLDALAEVDSNGGQDHDYATTDSDTNVLLEKGRILDRLQRYDEAFTCFVAAKKLLREATGKSYLEQEAREMANRLRGFFVSDRIRLLQPARARAGSAQPVFILGFPRSGTTLVEQALSNHPSISAGDELPFINELSCAIPRLFGSPLSYPEALSELWMGNNRRGLEILRDIYLQRIETRGVVEPGHAWFTDKMPLNEVHLGLISLIFPHSPLIHILRHPLDVIVSAFSHQMSHGYLCAYALETLARQYVLVMDLVQHYRTEMPLRYLPIRYESMVDDIAGTVRRMLDFIGEPFEERCVNFQDNGRLPQTPSYAQVKEKIHDRSRFRYRNYLRHLESVIPIVQPVMDRLGYTVE
jgi:TPR repeat protein/tetratricopeptide (TPR) repeat protein